jgi:hypothetical protein
MYMNMKKNMNIDMDMDRVTGHGYREWKRGMDNEHGCRT